MDGTGTEYRITVLSYTDTGTVPTNRQADRNGLHVTKKKERNEERVRDIKTDRPTDRHIDRRIDRKSGTMTKRKA